MPEVREIAESAVSWCKQRAGTVPPNDLVQRISQCGTAGKHKSNCERDLHRVIRSVSNAVDVDIDHIKVRLWDHKDGREVWGSLPVIWPDKLASALYARGESIFQRCFAPRPSEIESYWKHVEQHCRWFDDHPGRQAANKKRLLPFCLYGDEINAFRNAENGSICVLGFGSDLAYGNPALERYYLFTAFSEHNSTENTFDDILKALVPRLRYMFEETSFNWCSAGWRWTYSSTQGDLKFITDRYGLHNFRKNRICDLCECVKTDDNVAMTLADFRETAAYRATQYTHQDYTQSTTPETRIQDALINTVIMFPMCSTLSVLSKHPI